MEEKRKSRVKQERGERGEEKRKRKENVFSFFSFAYARLCVRTYVCVYARAFSQRIGVLRGGCDSSCARGRWRTRRGRERERESESCSRGRKQRVGAGIDISTRETFLPLAGLRRFKVLFFSVPSLSFFLSPSHCAFRSLFLRGCSTRSLFLSRSLARQLGRSVFISPERSHSVLSVAQGERIRAKL